MSFRYLVLKSEPGDREAMEELVAVLDGVAIILDSPMVPGPVQHPLAEVARVVWTEVEVPDRPFRIVVTDDFGMPGRYLEFCNGTPYKREVGWKNVAFACAHWTADELRAAIVGSNPPPPGALVKLGLSLADEDDDEGRELFERMLRHGDPNTVLDAAMGIVVARWHPLLPALEATRLRWSDSPIVGSLDIGISRLREIGRERGPEDP
ncbi:MAG: hypothetical protein AAGA56_10450 [Myxococcota bacterium]